MPWLDVFPASEQENVVAALHVTWYLWRATTNHTADETQSLSAHHLGLLCSSGGSAVKNLPARARDAGGKRSFLRSGRSPGVGNGNPFYYSCLENSMDEEALWATVPGSCKESDKTEHANALELLRNEDWRCLSAVSHVRMHNQAHEWQSSCLSPSFLCCFSVNPVCRAHC